MTQAYYDHYFDAAEATAFLPLLASEPNIIGPCWGRDDLGSNPQRLYIAVRSAQVLDVPEGAEATDIALAQALLGVWA